MHSFANETIVENALADEYRPMSVLAAVGVWLGASAFGWTAVAAVMSGLA